jgi:hypothetical protein
MEKKLILALVLLSLILVLGYGSFVSAESFLDNNVYDGNYLFGLRDKTYPRQNYEYSVPDEYLKPWYQSFSDEDNGLDPATASYVKVWFSQRHGSQRQCVTSVDAFEDYCIDRWTLNEAVSCSESCCSNYYYEAVDCSTWCYEEMMADVGFCRSDGIVPGVDDACSNKEFRKTSRCECFYDMRL